jgi:hypothetical protein
MGVWEEMCIICGLVPGGGPRMLYCDLERSLEKLTKNIQGQNLQLDLDENQLRDELRKVLLFFDPKHYESGYMAYKKAVMDGSIPLVTYFPFDFEEWDGWKAIAIGIFEEPRDFSSDINGENKPSEGFVSCNLFYISSVHYISGCYNSPCDYAFRSRRTFSWSGG